MSYQDPLADRRLTVLQGGGDDFTAYPATHAGWINRYQFLIDAYHGETYTQQQIKELSLFRALDDDGKVIALTRRLHRDIQYLVDTARDALALGEVRLQRAEGASDADYETALKIWDRSGVDSQGSVWSFLLACCGDLYIEAARVEAGSQAVSLISYPPQNVFLEYDHTTGRRITRATITSDFLGEAEVDAQGNVTEAGALYTYQRTLTADSIEVTSKLPPSPEGRQQAELDAAASGPHGLGVVPVVHIRCIPTVYPEHSLPVTHGLERGLAEVDSLASQISAVGDRFGNPKPYLFGAKLGDGSAISRFGRWINAWGNGSDKITAGYLEPSMSGIAQLQEALQRLIADIRITFPEFLFLGGGSTANLSADALRLLATRYETKYRDIRSRLYHGLERALAIGVALENRAEYDPERHPVRIDGPPLLPTDKKSELEALQLAVNLGGVSRVDIVRATQALQLATSEASAEDYARLIAEEEMGTAASMMGDTSDLQERIQDATPDLQAAAETLQGLTQGIPSADSLEALQEALDAIMDALTALDASGSLDSLTASQDDQPPVPGAE